MKGGDQDVFLAAQQNCILRNSIVWMLKESHAVLSPCFQHTFGTYFVFLSNCAITLLPVTKVSKGTISV